MQGTAHIRLNLPYIRSNGHVNTPRYWPSSWNRKKPIDFVELDLTSVKAATHSNFFSCSWFGRSLRASGEATIASGKSTLALGEVLLVRRSRPADTAKSIPNSTNCLALVELPLTSAEFAMHWASTSYLDSSFGQIKGSLGRMTYNFCGI